MIPLQRKLRQLRSWQHMTLRQTAYPQRDALFVALETGDPKVLQAQLNPIENALTKEGMSTAYGIRQSLFYEWLEEEYDWRLSAGNATYTEIMPRLARYLYRPLSEAARNLFKDGLCVLDLETSGKDPHDLRTEIVEMTLLDTDGLPLLNSLIRPTYSIPQEAQAIHGITDEDVKDAPTFRELYPDIYRAINGQTLVVYNSDYDSYLLDKLIIQNRLDMPEWDAWCLMKAYADYYKEPGTGRHGNAGYVWQSLTRACEQQSVVLEEAHRSLGDTLATYRLLKTLAEKE